MELNGTAKVFIKELVQKEGTVRLYSTSVGTKQTDSTYLNFFLPISFSKEARKQAETLNNLDEISLKDCWFKVFKDSNGNNQLGLFVNTFKLVK